MTNPKYRRQWDVWPMKPGFLSVFLPGGFKYMLKTYQHIHPTWIKHNTSIQINAVMYTYTKWKGPSNSNNRTIMRFPSWLAWWTSWRMANDISFCCLHYGCSFPTFDSLIGGWQQKQPLMFGYSLVLAFDFIGFMDLIMWAAERGRVWNS